MELGTEFLVEDIGRVSLEVYMSQIVTSFLVLLKAPMLSSKFS